MVVDLSPPGYHVAVALKRTVVTTNPDGTQTVTEETVTEQKAARLGCLGLIAVAVVAAGPLAWGWPLWVAILSWIALAVILSVYAVRRWGGT